MFFFYEFIIFHTHTYTQHTYYHQDRNAYTQVINSLQCCCLFPLKKCKVSEIFPGNFKLTCQGDGIIFCSENVNMAQNWITALREAIEIHIQCRKTIRKGSSKRRPIRKKDLNKFEQNENIQSPFRKVKDLIYIDNDLFSLL